MTTLIPTRTRRRMSFSREPFRGFREDVNELINQLLSGGNSLHRRIALSLDLSETKDAFKLEMDLPGVEAEDIEIEVRDRTVTISGDHVTEQEQPERSFHRIERRRGRFYRSIELPCDVERDKIKADYKNGILTVTLPKSESGQTLNVPVQSGH